MNKKIISFSVLSSLLAPALAIAQPPLPGVFGGSIFDIILIILNIVWLIFVAIAIILFVVAGITFLTAQGEPEKVKQARGFVIWGAVGVAIGLLAFSIITILRTTLGV